MKKLLLPLLALTLATSALADPRRSLPAREQALTAIDLDVLNVMMDRAADIQDAAKYGNGVSAVSVTKVGPVNQAVSTYRFDITNCRGGVVGCLGGAHLTITRTTRPSIPPHSTYEVRIVPVRGAPGYPRDRNALPVSALGLETVSAIFGTKVNSSVAEDFVEFSKLGNQLTTATVTRTRPGETVYRLTNQQCRNLPASAGCFGGAVLSIRRRELNNRPASHEVEIKRLRSVAEPSTPPRL